MVVVKVGVEGVEEGKCQVNKVERLGGYASTSEVL